MRKKWSNKEKARISLESIREKMTLSEIASKYKVHPNQVSKWKKQLIENLPELFSNGKNNKGSEMENQMDELYKEIGKLKVENEYLKKTYNQIYG